MTTQLNDKTEAAEATEPATIDDPATDSPESGADTVATRDFASWRARAFAYLIDVGCPAATIAALLGTAASADSDHWVQLPAIIVAGAVLAATVWNVGFRQGKTGRTFGKTMLGIRTDRVHAGTPPGVVRALFREAARVADTVPVLIGWFWPMRDARGQTFSDKLADTIVSATPADITDNDRARARSMALGAFALLALATVGLAATQYTYDYRRDHASEQVRSDAPRIATDATVALLSYKPETVDADLAAASSKLTGDFLSYYEDYTKKVVIPAAKEKKVSTRAQAAGTAVISADDHHATVLVFINQTTTTAENPQPATMSSTVRVDLVEIGHEWRISQFEPI
ncbi:RDD family protein [Nocardia sp. NBC_00565]|uniref:RDD family protein n=1 Tax=Nocardia sp. NBC_00565 TaxID=2975993 RepID=UPI002E810FAC|nr:RDD family protein [Nocardia sp. NBC_00565]WUC05660.1 RDD family protein [Nocardia sp. NBC_00565]